MRRTLSPLWLALGLSAVPTAADQSPPLALTHVNVIDTASGAVHHDMTVLVAGNRITAVGKAGATRLPDKAQVVDGTGKFLIPGLWDAHTHLSMWTELALPLFVAHGITGVRDMGGTLQEIDSWRADVAKGSVIGPLIVRPGPIIDGPKQGAVFRLTVRDADEARAAVRKLRSDGVDFIKIHNGVPRDAYFGLAAEARSARIAFVGHIPVFITPEEASRAGQATIEHSESLFESYAFQLALERATRVGDPAVHSTEAMFGAAQKMLAEVFSSFTDSRAAALFRSFVAHGNAYAPLLVAYHEATQRRTSSEPIADPRSKYLAASATKNWDQWFPWRQSPPEILERRQVAFDRFRELAGLAARNGVMILAGSDHFPGFSVHEELALLAKAGLTPLQALQAATLNPAKVLGLLSDVGTIEEGKRADLVLLDASPLDDIRNTRRIRAVVVAGRLLTREKLNQVLADLEVRARSR